MVSKTCFPKSTEMKNYQLMSLTHLWHFDCTKLKVNKNIPQYDLICSHYDPFVLGDGYHRMVFLFKLCTCSLIKCQEHYFYTVSFSSRQMKHFEREKEGRGGHASLSTPYFPFGSKQKVLHSFIYANQRITSHKTIKNRHIWLHFTYIVFF